MKISSIAQQNIQHARQYVAIGDVGAAVVLLNTLAAKARLEFESLKEDQRKLLVGSSRVKSLGQLAARAKRDAAEYRRVADQILAARL